MKKFWIVGLIILLVLGGWLLKRSNYQKIANEGSEFVLKFADGWGLNAAAPSQLTLWSEETGNAIASWDRPTLVGVKQYLFPALVSGDVYRLDGTIIFCEKANTRVCVTKKIDLEFRATSDGAQQLIVDLASQ